MNLAIIGATGNVGRKTIEILEKSKINIEKLFLVASERSEGKKIKFKDNEIKIQSLEKYDFSNAQITFFAAGSKIAEKWVPKASKKTVVIDNSKFFRMDKDVPLIVPEVNPEQLKHHKNQNFDGKFTLIKGYSDSVVPKLDKVYDVIFVDGNHTYAQCKKDFEMAFEKSKVGTDFIFHNAGIEEVEECYPDGGPYKVCEELKKDDRLSYTGKPTERVKVFRRIK